MQQHQLTKPQCTWRGQRTGARLDGLPQHCRPACRGYAVQERVVSFRTTSRLKIAATSGPGKDHRRRRSIAARLRVEYDRQLPEHLMSSNGMGGQQSLHFVWTAICRRGAPYTVDEVMKRSQRCTWRSRYRISLHRLSQRRRCPTHCRRRMRALVGDGAGDDTDWRRGRSGRPRRLGAMASRQGAAAASTFSAIPVSPWPRWSMNRVPWAVLAVGMPPQAPAWRRWLWRRVTPCTSTSACWYGRRRLV